MNPARDFAPRLFAYLAGWGNLALPGNNYFWVPILGPLLGAGLGGFLYEKILSNNWITKPVQAEKRETSSLEQSVSYIKPKFDVKFFHS